MDEIENEKEKDENDGMKTLQKKKKTIVKSGKIFSHFLQRDQQAIISTDPMPGTISAEKLFGLPKKDVFASAIGEKQDIFSKDIKDAWHPPKPPKCVIT